MEKESCANCKLCLNLEILDYSQGGCKHTIVKDDYICLVYEDEGTACLMKGKDRNNEMCECWTPKERTV